MCGGNSIDYLENCAKEQLAVVLVDMQQNFVGGIGREKKTTDNSKSNIHNKMVHRKKYSRNCFGISRRRKNH